MPPFGNQSGDGHDGPAQPERLDALGGPHRTPRRREPAFEVDPDRLLAGAASALLAEERGAGEQGSGERGAGQPGSDAGAAAGPTSDSTSSTPGWLRVAVPAAVAVALLTAGVATLGNSGSTGSEHPKASGANPSAATLPSTSAVPTSLASTTAAPTTAASTTAATAAPTTAAPAATAPADGPPPHKATYRDGKLYLEGRISSQEEAHKYVEKASAVLGAANVVNHYEIDPSVPLSTDGTVYVDEPFLFETGSAALNPTYTGILGLGIAAMRLTPGARMVVTGYTDNVGDPGRNATLSLARAQAVVDYMVTTGGIDRSRFDAVGAGDANPVGDNATEEGRQLNRRIDVRLVHLLG